VSKTRRLNLLSHVSFFRIGGTLQHQHNSGDTRHWAQQNVARFQKTICKLRLTSPVYALTGRYFEVRPYKGRQNSDNASSSLIPLAVHHMLHSFLPTPSFLVFETRKENITVISVMFADIWQFPPKKLCFSNQPNRETHILCYLAIQSHVEIWVWFEFAPRNLCFDLVNFGVVVFGVVAFSVEWSAIACKKTKFLFEPKFVITLMIQFRTPHPFSRGMLVWSVCVVDVYMLWNTYPMYVLQWISLKKNFFLSCWPPKNGEIAL